MAIEFRCPSCDQQLRVPDTAGGKNAKCPKCQTILAVPASASAASPPAPLGPPPQQGFSAAPPPLGPPMGPPPGPPTGGPLPSQQPNFNFGGPVPPKSANPFAGEPGSPFASKPVGGPHGESPFAGSPGGSPNVNPYAAPQGGYAPAYQPGPGGIGHQIVEIGPIINHSLKVWQENLGILIAVTILPQVIIMPFSMIISFMAPIAEANDSPELLIVAMAILVPLMLVASIYLTVGQLHVMLKLARQQKATIGDMFISFQKVLPMLGFALLFGIMVYIGLILCIIPGMILIFMYWPAYFLIADDKAGVMDSFGKASSITRGNHLTTFLVYLCGVGFIMLGYLAVCIGVLFAAPLVMLMWTTAYLMMSGQIPVPAPNQPAYR